MGTPRTALPPQMRLCMVNVISKLLVMRSRRGRQDDLNRRIHMPLAAEAARQGALKEALRLLEENSKDAALSEMSRLGIVPCEQDV